MFLFSGCNNHYYYDYNELTSSVKQIYIVEVQRSEYYGEISIKYLKEIKEEFNVFLEDLSELRYESSVLLSPQNNTGKAIMLVYSDEEYDYGIIGLNGIEKFKNNTQTYLYNARCDEDKFNLILDNYYD